MARFLRFARPCPRQGDAQKIIDRLEVLGTEPARMVAKVIRNCATDDPCRSLACPMCRHWAQCAFVGAVAGVWNPTAANTTLTLIPLDGVLDYDALDDFDLLALNAATPWH